MPFLGKVLVVDDDQNVLELVKLYGEGKVLMSL